MNLFLALRQNLAEQKYFLGVICRKALKISLVSALMSCLASEVLAEPEFMYSPIIHMVAQKVAFF